MTIGLMPSRSNPADFDTVTLTVATAKYGSVLTKVGETTHDGAHITTTAGEQPSGVCNSQGDPNNSGLFAIGAVVSMARGGDAEVLFDAGTVLTVGAKIIASGTDGTAKVLEAETDPYWLLGTSNEDRTIGASPGLASVRLSIQWIAKD